ncbi:malate synthase G, partial [Alphaproteobacteria bacterium]|nr:malate synthase G [Alphaproteobacteria bacterium]
RDFSNLIYDFSPKNNALLDERLSIQNKIDLWHKEKLGKEINVNEYEVFLKSINYLLPEGPDFKIETDKVDPEIAFISGPQLVVPITNSRYVLNAVNARWGSFYDAIYGTDVLGSTPQNSSYDTERGKKVIEYAKSHLDNFAPLNSVKWNKITKIVIESNKLNFFINEKSYYNLEDNNQFAGYKLNEFNQINEILLMKNNLHCRILIDSKDSIGKNDIANISDIILESAISAIIDCEDSVATVDAEDKILAYRNWLGLMKGDLNSTFIKNNKKIKRTLNFDHEFLDPFGRKFNLKGRALILIRNVGHLMKTSAIIDKNGEEIGEGIMDAVITSLIALYDLKNKNNKNSVCGSIYIVKPKMHGPQEVSFTNELFSRVEDLLNLDPYTIKIGIMDEERRTSVNLKECIRAAKFRLAFINTGFLDRTGDEIHTSMHAGPFIKKGDMKNSEWIQSYENRNVEIGISCGLMGKAQIGKGMWAMPDKMSLMIKQKINHPNSGANCAWVPSPTAATLHSMHYHLINVQDIQNQILNQNAKGSLDNLLKLPLLKGTNLSAEEIKQEIENNAQGILGYVVRWVDQGIGCSKVLDINNIGLMEDRATCRISSQALANWMLHNIVTETEVLNVLKKMAKIVDDQNNNDSNYVNMSPSFKGKAFQAAYELIFKGLDQPSGYTEPILHLRRSEFKNQ